MTIAPSTKGRLADLGLRIGSGLVMVGLALGSLWYSGQVFLLFWLLAAVLLHWEWQTMAGGQHLAGRVICGTAVLVLAGILAWGPNKDYAVLALLAGAGGLAVLAGPQKRVWAASGLLYAGALLLALWLLRYSNPGIYRRMAILWLFAVVWGTDIMAYFGGRLIGGPKLWPRVSPSKTWSGTLVGIGSGALLGLAVTQSFAYMYDTPVNQGGVFVLGLAAGMAAQAGDLLESSMKRFFGVKDSSNLIPGHGGVMDRLDGFVTAAVLVAGLGTWRFGPGLAVNGLFQW